jgi:Tfp pilus assembly protein PilF
MFSHGLWFAVLFALLSCLRVVSGPSPSPDELAAEFTLADLALAGRWLSTGQVLEAQGLAHLALEAFLVAARLDPRLPTPHESMGKIFEIHFGDAEGAAPHYRRAKQRASTDAQMHYLMGNFATSRGQHARAARLHAAAIALQPSFFEAHNNLATALISLANEANQSHHHTVYFFVVSCAFEMHRTLLDDSTTS